MIRFIIIGSDGLWDYLTKDEAVKIVIDYLEHGIGDRAATSKAVDLSTRETQVAEVLVKRALQAAAKEAGLTIRQLYRLKAGKERRGYHDDTTALVVFLETL